MADQASGLHPIVQAAARALAAELAHGHIDGGMFVTFTASDGHLSAGGATPVDAARVAAPAALREAAAMHDSPERTEADRVSAWLRDLAAEVAGGRAPEVGPGYLGLVDRELWAVWSDAGRTLEGTNAGHRGALVGDLRRMAGELERAIAAVEQAPEDPEVLGGGTDG